METLLRIPMSYEDYQALPEHPRAEWVDGVALIMAAAPLQAHQRASRRLANLLEASLPDLSVDEGLAVRLPRNRERIPDVLALRAPPAGRVVTDVPVIVAEVLSPSTASEDLLRKGPEYAEAGVAQFWVVNIDTRTIEVLENVEGRWELVAVVVAAHPAVDVVVGEYGTVTVELDAVLR